MSWWQGSRAAISPGGAPRDPRPGVVWSAPTLSEKLVPLLGGSRAGVRLEAAQALAQAAQGFRSDCASRVPRRGVARDHRRLRGPCRPETDSEVLGMVALSLPDISAYLSSEEIQAAREQYDSLSLRAREEFRGTAQR